MGDCGDKIQNTMQAVILTEAGNHFGLGHLSRCVALKKHLLKANFYVELYNRGDFESSEASHFDWLDEINRTILDKKLESKPLLIIDSYYANFEFCKAMVEKSKVCVFFDDFSRMIYPQDSIILNGALNANKYYIDIKNEKFVGIEYGLLRDEFLERSEKKINKDIVRVLITLGGNDYANNTQKVLEIIEKECVYAMIDVIIAHNHKPLQYGFNTTIHTDLDTKALKKLMLECDLAISGGGVTMVELQSTLTPTIALNLAPNQSYQLYEWQKIGLRVAKDSAQVKGLIKGLKKFKDRNKVYNNLSKIEIGSKIPQFVEFLKEKYQS